jgi:hypothetical protein
MYSVIFYLYLLRRSKRGAFLPPLAVGAFSFLCLVQGTTHFKGAFSAPLGAGIFLIVLWGLIVYFLVFPTP